MHHVGAFRNDCGEQKHCLPVFALLYASCFYPPTSSSFDFIPFCHLYLMSVLVLFFCLPYFSLSFIFLPLMPHISLLKCIVFLFPWDTENMS